MPRPYQRAATGLGIFFAMLAMRHEGNGSVLMLPTAAAVVYTAFAATYLVWRLQSRRDGRAA